MDELANNYVLILAGGTGSRFWPYSRLDKPKQFQDILGVGKSLLQLTYDRFAAACPPENIYVITHQDYVHHVKSQLPAVRKECILEEPFRRNTAPCIAYASHKIAKMNPKATCIVTPSDHVILNQESFSKTLSVAISKANDQEKLITIGIQPSRPDTVFGYIQYHAGNDLLKKVKTFTEKPEQSLASKFLESGDFVWNSGIFIWSVKAISKALSQHLPELNDSFLEVREALNTADEKKAILSAYSHISNISIDYGVLEKSSDVYVVLGDFGWSDLGSWEALHTISEKDNDHNAIRANTMLYKTTNTLVTGPRDTLMVVEGLDNYLVTLSDNVLLICRRNDEAQLRHIMADARSKKGKKYL